MSQGALRGHVLWQNPPHVLWQNPPRSLRSRFKMGWKLGDREPRSAPASFQPHPELGSCGLEAFGG